MQIEQAKAGAAIAVQIEQLQVLIGMIDTAIAEAWPITVMRASAPAEGASSPQGTSIDLLPAGPANTENSQMGLAQARATYQAQLDALTTQLAAL